MKYDPDVHHRRSIRLRGFDYAQAGAYFVTVCVRETECPFGDVVDGQMQLSGVGQIVQSAWEELPKRFPAVALDQYVIMPNHVHGIIVLVGAQFIAPNMAAPPHQGVINHAPTLGEIVRAFKAVASRRIRSLGVPPFAWQGNYYEHIVRNDDELCRIREYIANNPLRWETDELHPDNSSPG